LTTEQYDRLGLHLVSEDNGIRRPKIIAQPQAAKDRLRNPAGQWSAAAENADAQEIAMRRVTWPLLSQ
jgi:hypothetical protein